MKTRIHLAWCEHCDKRIAWSRKRRQWLALAPTSGASTQLARRMACSSGRSLHDPAPQPLPRRFWILAGVR